MKREGLPSNTIEERGITRPVTTMWMGLRESNSPMLSLDLVGNRREGVKPRKTHHYEREPLMRV